ncbi:putative senescence-associated protein [Balamuthia mandrillaris]
MELYGTRTVPEGTALSLLRLNTERAYVILASGDSGLEAFSHNPADGRADIEGSKSDVAMNAWPPQASYPCDVPPQPNSPPDYVFNLDQPRCKHRDFNARRRVSLPAST